MAEPAVPETHWLRVAAGVLPSLPCDATMLLDDGGQVPAKLQQVTYSALSAEMPVLDARKGLRLTIPIDGGDRGGYSISCTVEEVYFMGGLNAAAVLRVDHVARRKPYRLKERMETDASVELRVLKSAASSPGAVVVGRMLDISSSGAGLLLDQELGIGDRLQIETQIPGLHISSQAAVVQVERASFGRWRLGCQFTMLPPNQERRIDQFVARTTGAATMPEAQAPISGGVDTN